MQQNINPENEYEMPEKNAKLKNFQIVKCKGKPFWLNLSQNKKKNYQRYKTQTPSQITETQVSFSPEKSNQLTEQPANQKQENESNEYFQTILSDNQNYQQDFESYKESLNRTKKIDIKLPNLTAKGNQPKTNARFNKIDISLVNSPQRKFNKQPVKNRINSDLMAKILPKQIKSLSKIKPLPQQQSQFDASKQILFHQNPAFLRDQNKRMIQKIQQIRQMIPFYHKNKYQMFQQNLELANLHQKVKRATSFQYQYQIQSNKSLMQLNHKQTASQLRKMNSPKFESKNKSFISDKFIVQMNRQQKTRQKLLHQMRLYCLKQEKNIKLQQKVLMYQNILSKIEVIEKTFESQNLKRRKIFLEWDIQRMKNQFDLKIIQNKIEVNEVKGQIQILSRLIDEKGMLIEQSNQKEKQQIKKQQQQTKQRQITISKQFRQNKSFIFKRKPRISEIKNFSSVNFNQLQTSQQINQSSLVIQNPESKTATNQQKLKILYRQIKPSDQKNNKVKQNEKFNIKIKKSIFNDAQLDQDMEELIL